MPIGLLRLTIQSRAMNVCFAKQLINCSQRRTKGFVENEQHIAIFFFFFLQQVWKLGVLVVGHSLSSFKCWLSLSEALY